MRLSNQTRTYSTWQSIPYRSYIGRLVVSGDILVLNEFTNYEIKIIAKLDGYGASSNVYVNFEDNLLNVIQLIKFDITDDPIGSEKEITFFVESKPIPQQKITQTQNIGTNAGVDYIISYRYTPSSASILTSKQIKNRRGRLIFNFSTEKQLEKYKMEKMKKIKINQQKKKRDK